MSCCPWVDRFAGSCRLQGALSVVFTGSCQLHPWLDRFAGSCRLQGALSVDATNSGRIGGPVSGQVGHLRQIAVRMGGWTRPAWPSVRGQGLLNLVGETFEPIRSELSNLDGQLQPCRANAHAKWALAHAGMAVLRALCSKYGGPGTGKGAQPRRRSRVPCRANAHTKWAPAHARMVVLRALPSK